MILVAHRCCGDHQAVAAFVAAGANAFEVDVALGPDGLRVSHFASLPGTGGQIEYDGWSLRRRSGQRGDPHLTDVLAQLPPTAPVLLDLKETNPTGRDRLRASLLDLGSDGGRLTITTDHGEDIRRFGEAGFTTWRTLGDRPALSRYLASPGAAEGLTVKHEVLTEAVVARLTQDLGATVVAWTVNDPRRALELRRWGVNGITTDSPAVMRELH